MKRTQGEGKKKKVHKASSFFKTEKTLTDMKVLYNCIFTALIIALFFRKQQKRKSRESFSLPSEHGKIGFCTCLERKSVLQVNHGLFDLHQQKLYGS